ncbi:MAG: MATE family efflux transporter [Clostridia bacterium]|nr:MATE family efflux transporter [Clostridia bacterium]
MSNLNVRGFIGSKDFYRQTLAIALPIMIQNFITNFVSMLDNLMVGAVGTEQMSGVSIDNQLIFIFNLALFGVLSGAGIFTAQYHGKEDTDGVRYTLRYKAISAMLLFSVAVTVFAVFKENLISLYLHDGEMQGSVDLTMKFAKQYFNIILLGLFPFAVSQVVASTLRETGETVAPMVMGFVAVFTNCSLNYVLIFGKLGMPILGIRGAAIATVVSRYVECICIVIYAIVKRERFPYIKGAFSSLRIPRKLTGTITVKALPLLMNEFFWSLGMSLLTMGYSMHGINVVAGTSISSTVMNLFNIAFLSLGSSIGIIVGKQLGAGKFEDAVDTNRKLTAFSFAVAVGIGIIVLLSGGAIPMLYRTNEASKMYASYFIRVSGCFLPFVSISNASYFTLRSGGKTWLTILFDSVFVMCLWVPFVFILYWAGLSIWIVYPLVQSLEILKALLGVFLVRKRVWVRNIVE